MTDPMATPPLTRRARADAPLRAIVGSLADAWNGGDPRALDDLFTDDAELFDVTADLRRGAVAVEALRAEILGGSHAGARCRFTDIHLRRLTATVALAHATWQINAAGPGRPRRQGAILLVLRAEATGWRIAAAQTTLHPASAWLAGPLPNPS